jgi:hypothetical protein
MKLKSVSFAGVRGLRDATFDFTSKGGAPHDVIVFGGPTASGKTRALEAILAAKEAIAPYGPMVQGAPWIAAGAAATKVRLAFWLDADEQAEAGVTAPVLEAEVTFLPQRARGTADEGLAPLLARYAHEGKAGKVEYFPANRRIPVLPPFGGLGVAEQRMLRPTKDARKYGFIVRALRDLEGDAARTQAFAARLEALSPTCRYVPGVASEGMPRCLSSRGGPVVTPADLSDSEADAVIFAATATFIGLDRSLVLVDRPDLYLDAGYAGRFVAGLRSLGEGCQLLLASPSPDFAAAAAPAQVITLEGA